MPLRREVRLVKVWMVFVKVRYEKRLQFRYLDSQWARKKAAETRREDLQNSFESFGCKSVEHGCWADILESTVADTAITDSGEKAEAKTG